MSEIEKKLVELKSLRMKYESDLYRINMEISMLSLIKAELNKTNSNIEKKE